MAEEETVKIVHDEAKGEAEVTREAYEQYHKKAGWKLAPRSEQPKSDDQGGAS